MATPNFGIPNVTRQPPPHPMDSSSTHARVQSANDMLNAAIAEEAKVKQAAELASEGVTKFQKLENGSVSEVIVLNQNNKNNYVLGARWWCNCDKQKSYLSIMNFKKVQRPDETIAFEPVDFGKRISLTLADFGALRDYIPDITEQYYSVLTKDQERTKKLQIQMEQIEAAANSMKVYQRQQMYGSGFKAPKAGNGKRPFE